MTKIIKKHLQLRDYKRVLYDKCVVHRNMHRFGTDHQVYTIKSNKVALRGDNDKGNSERRY